MCFTALAGHECFASHETWKLETKPAVWKIKSMMDKRQRQREGEESDAEDPEG